MNNNIRDFKTLLSRDRMTRQKISRTTGLNATILTRPRRHQILHPAKAKYTFFSYAQRTLSRIDNAVGHKTKFKRLKSNGFTNEFYQILEDKLPIILKLF